MKNYDVIIIGAGAAGLKAASVLVSRKKSVLIVDMGDEPARKIAVSGGGKCNFTNTHADHTHYFGKNPQFVRSALSQWTPIDTLNWVKSHKIEYLEKEPGRFFCKNTAKDILDALLTDIKETEILYKTNVSNIVKKDDTFTVYTSNGTFTSKSVIVATGGVSYPNLGVSNAGHIIAKQFGHKIEPVRPALCPVKTKSFSAELSGISNPVEIIIDKNKISGDLLFTHFGIGGPAVYRATLFSSPKITINFAQNLNVYDFLKSAKHTNGKKNTANVLSEILPTKLAHFLCKDSRNIADLRDDEIKLIADKVNHFEITDASAIGMASAEVTFGGISTDNISSKTMESKLCDRLYFAGEVIDITGDLGGYNIQWAFSSGYVAGTNA